MHSKGVRDKVRARTAWLRRCRAGALAGLAVWASGAGAAPPAGAAADAPVQAAWRAQALAPQDPARFAWMRAADALGREAEALHLRQALLDGWLLTLEGRPQRAVRTVEAAMAQGREVAADDLQRRDAPIAEG